MSKSHGRKRQRRLAKEVASGVRPPVSVKPVVVRSVVPAVPVKPTVAKPAAFLAPTRPTMAGPAATVFPAKPADPFVLARPIKLMPTGKPLPRWLAWTLVVVGACLFVGRMIGLTAGILPSTSWLMAGMALPFIGIILLWEAPAKLLYRMIWVTAYGVALIITFTFAGPAPAVVYPHGHPEQAKDATGFTIFNPLTTHLELFENTILVSCRGKNLNCTFQGSGLDFYQCWGSFRKQKTEVDSAVAQTAKQLLLQKPLLPDSLFWPRLNDQLHELWPNLVRLEKSTASKIWLMP